MANIYMCRNLPHTWYSGVQTNVRQFFKLGLRPRNPGIRFPLVKKIGKKEIFKNIESKVPKIDREQPVFFLLGGQYFSPATVTATATATATAMAT